MTIFHKIIWDQRGIAFITALAMMLILLTLGAGYMVIARSEVKVSTNQINTLKQFYAAEAGIEYAIADLIKNNGIGGNVNGSLGNFNYQTTYNTSSKSITATVNNLQFVQAQVTFLPTKYAIYSNQGIKFSADATGTIKGDLRYNNNPPSSGFSLGISQILIGTSSLETAGETTPSLTLTPFTVPLPVINEPSNFTFSKLNSPLGNGVFDGFYKVQGMATIEDNVVINGTVWAAGDIKTNGPISYIEVNPDPAGNNPALYSEGKILLDNINSTSMKKSKIKGAIVAKELVSLTNSKWLEVKDLITINPVNVCSRPRSTPEPTGCDVFMQNDSNLTVNGLIYTDETIAFYKMNNS